MATLLKMHSVNQLTESRKLDKIQQPPNVVRKVVDEI